MKNLAIVSTHPIQYYAPVFRLLAADRRVNLKVFYTWGESSVKKHDPGFEQTVEWDIPLLEGYPYQFVRNTSSDPGSHHFFGIQNPDLINDIRAFRPDVILVYGWAWHSHLRVMRYFSKKVPIWFRGDSTLLNKTPGFKHIIRSVFLRWVYTLVDTAFYVGANNKQYFLNYGLSDSQLVFAPHAVDNARFSADRSEEAASLRASVGISASAVVILFAAKMDENKNAGALLHALKSLEESQDLHVILVGDGPLKNKLEIAFGGPRVHFSGFVNQSQMPVFYQACDLYCLPSWNESWGLSVNEAMAAGKAVLVSDTCGCAPDLVKENGKIVKPGNTIQLEGAIKALADKSRLKRMGKISQEIIAEYTIEVQARAMLTRLFND